MSFADLGLSDQLLRAVADSGYDTPTPIQKGAIPSVLMGKDLIGIAQTGTGKTASFVLPMIDILAEGRSRARMPRSLILEPTRELAAQVAENFEKYGKYHKLSMALLIGGVQMGDQVKALEKGVDVLIATPGPADGPVQPRQDHAQRLQPAGHRRSRPDARHGLHPRHRGNLHQAAQAAPDPAVLGDHAAADQEAGGQIPDRSQDDRSRPAGNRQRQYRAAADRHSRRQEARRAAQHPARRRIQERDRLLQQEDHGSRTLHQPQALGLRGRPDPGRHGPERPHRRVRPLQEGRDQHPRRLRRRRARARRQGRQPRHQLRRSVAARRLYPPHRPHRPRRDQGHRHHAGDARGRRSGRGDREADRHQTAACRGRKRAEACRRRRTKPPRRKSRPRRAAVRAASPKARAPSRRARAPAPKPRATPRKAAREAQLRAKAQPARRPTQPASWNGPVPSFLPFSAL